jgi:hypothetical protein
MKSAGKGCADKFALFGASKKLWHGALFGFSFSVGNLVALI